MQNFLREIQYFIDFIEIITMHSSSSSISTLIKNILKKSVRKERNGNGFGSLTNVCLNNLVKILSNF